MHLLKKISIARDDSITFGNFVDKVAEMYGDSTCFILDRPVEYSFISGTEPSYIQWKEFTDRMAHVLEDDLGVKKGDRVIVDMSNRMEIWFTCVAVKKIGAGGGPPYFNVYRPGKS